MKTIAGRNVGKVQYTIRPSKLRNLNKKYKKKIRINQKLWKVPISNRINIFTIRIIWKEIGLLARYNKVKADMFSS